MPRLGSILSCRRCLAGRRAVASGAGPLLPRVWLCAPRSEWHASSAVGRRPAVVARALHRCTPRTGLLPGRCCDHRAAARARGAMAAAAARQRCAGSAAARAAARPRAHRARGRALAARRSRASPSKPPPAHIRRAQRWRAGACAATAAGTCRSEDFGGRGDARPGFTLCSASWIL